MYFLIAAVVADAANLGVRAVHEIPVPARETCPVCPPCHPTPTRWPRCHSFTACAQLVNHASNFVSGTRG